MCMKKYYKLLMILSLFNSCLVFGADKVEVKKDSTIPKIELDTGKLEENIASKPVFNSTSSDQKQVDESLENNQGKFDDLSFTHIERLVECGTLKTIDEIQKCKKDYLKIKK